ncbi:hypothetical protein L228DRAFT_283913 [Xylona heveae TC161]|uniref:Sister chromatid cohesion acetyltransferase Eco1 n=1 Tax=Xylona heveae (strain CBS 132557 / TC161) TaxID=1328760 RepID=A0A165G652_XYLHT|nr:hypothetical protein L228DRAFT_283913 [Xylona heveae TC161]KZF21783.1 hypothetical protein L228DRAFT_283913 [Xylona heveae TC161]
MSFSYSKKQKGLKTYSRQTRSCIRPENDAPIAKRRRIEVHEDQNAAIEVGVKFQNSLAESTRASRRIQIAGTDDRPLDATRKLDEDCDGNAPKDEFSSHISSDLVGAPTSDGEDGGRLSSFDGLAATELQDSTLTTPPSSPPPIIPIDMNIRKIWKPMFSAVRRRSGNDIGARKSQAQSTQANLLGVAHTDARSSKISKGKRQSNLIQMQIDVGIETRRTCKACGMDYVPSSAEDDALHKRYHASQLGDGIDFGKGSTKWPESNRIWESAQFSAKASAERSTGLRQNSTVDYVVVVDQRSSFAEKRKARKALDIVTSELSAVSIDERTLWGTSKKETPSSCGRRPMGFANDMCSAETSTDPTELSSSDSEQALESIIGGDRYKIYLYMSGDKCVGLCLAERIAGAYQVLDGQDEVVPQKQETCSKLPTPIPSSPTTNAKSSLASAISRADIQQSSNDMSREEITPPILPRDLEEQHSDPSPNSAGPESPKRVITSKSSSISISAKPTSAVLGISRIWTSRSHRRHGIAATLLDCARDRFIYGMKIPKDLIAFSQPTESGVRLAENWFGKDKRWHVYRED